MPSPRILLIEDDELTSSLLSTVLSDQGYAVTPAFSGKAAMIEVAKNNFDLILLDLNLPDEDGLYLMRKIRARSDTPIFILTSRKSLHDRITGLDEGADDFITKPFDTTELLLRIRNTLRRVAPSSNKLRQFFQFDQWTLNASSRLLINPKGEEVPLTGGEFNILTALLSAQGRLLSREQLLNAIARHDEPPSERMADVFVSRLRRKIEKNPRKPDYIITKSGYGYQFSEKALIKSP